MLDIKLTNTNAGLVAIQRALAGEDITFTKLDIGDGVLTSLDISNFTGVINKIKNYPLGVVKPEGQEMVRLRANINNVGITEDKTIREFGVYAKFGSSEQEFLFAYMNTGGLVTALPNASGGRYELNRDFVLYLGNDINVTFNTNGDLVYATLNDLKTLDNKKEDKVEKNSGYNREKTDLTENDSDKLFTSLGALNLKNWLVANYTTLINNVRESLTNLIDTKLNHGGYGGNAQDIVNMINNLNICPYRVGDVLKTTSDIHPAISWVGTSWEKIENRFLMGTSGSEGAGGIGGASEIRLSVAHMPSHGHNLNITLQANGRHRHRVDDHIHGQPQHYHTLTAPVYGSGWYGQGGNLGGMGSITTSSAGGENTGVASPYTSFEPDHTHSVSASITETGTGQSFSIVPPYYKVHIWERLS